MWSQHRCSHDCFSIPRSGCLEGKSIQGLLDLANIQLALLYGSIAMEMIVTPIQVMRQSHVKVPTERVEERYGCFILIIL
jgi:hypothetical protein